MQDFISTMTSENHDLFYW